MSMSEAEELEALIERFAGAIHDGDVDKAEARLEELVRHPRARLDVVLSECWHDLAELFCHQGRTDEAVAAQRRALDEGWESEPDGRMDIARYLADAGRFDEVRAIHAEVAADTPEDPWFYHAAGLNETSLGDEVRAEEWFAKGLRLCQREERHGIVLCELRDFRKEALRALGRVPDELQEAADESIVAADGLLFFDGVGEMELPQAPASTRSRDPIVAGFIPRDQIDDALARWPRLAEVWGAAHPDHYYASTAALLEGFQRRGGRTPILVPVNVDEIAIAASESGYPATSPALIHAEAKHLLDEKKRHAAPWPPGRNAPCWCGSGRKHKKCCLRPPASIPENALPPAVYELEVRLEGVDPAPWRRIQLPSTASFLDLHDAIQDACGWQRAHLFKFQDKLGNAIVEVDEGEDAVDSVPLGSHFGVFDRCTYLYDFGDGWRHELLLLRRVEPSRSSIRCLIDGEGAFPPEDCGGVPGYQRCIASARGKAADEELLEWLGDWSPDSFDLQATKKAFDLHKG